MFFNSYDTTLYPLPRNKTINKRNDKVVSNIAYLHSLKQYSIYSTELLKNESHTIHQKTFMRGKYQIKLKTQLQYIKFILFTVSLLTHKVVKIKLLHHEVISCSFLSGAKRRCQPNRW